VLEKMKIKIISVVIPLFDEEESIPELYHRLNKTLENTKLEYELLFIDDGSRDNSFSILKDIQERDKHVRIIKFRKNFGQSAAMNIGFKHVKGDVIVSIDADLQNHPEDIPKLLDKIKEGYEVVSGWRFSRKDPLEKKLFLADYSPCT